MPFTVYVLRSLRNGRHYVGFTSRPLEQRLQEHNRGYPKGWPSHNRPFEVVYQEVHECEDEARARERFLKSGRGREMAAKNANPSDGLPPAEFGFLRLTPRPMARALLSFPRGPLPLGGGQGIISSLAPTMTSAGGRYQ